MRHLFVISAASACSVSAMNALQHQLWLQHHGGGGAANGSGFDSTPPQPPASLANPQGLVPSSSHSALESHIEQLRSHQRATRTVGEDFQRRQPILTDQNRSLLRNGPRSSTQEIIAHIGGSSHGAPGGVVSQLEAREALQSSAETILRFEGNQRKHALVEQREFERQQHEAELAHQKEKLEALKARFTMSGQQLDEREDMLVAERDQEVAHAIEMQRGIVADDEKNAADAVNCLADLTARQIQLAKETSERNIQMSHRAEAAEQDSHASDLHNMDAEGQRLHQGQMMQLEQLKKHQQMSHQSGQRAERAFRDMSQAMATNHSNAESRATALHMELGQAATAAAETQRSDLGMQDWLLRNREAQLHSRNMERDQQHARQEANAHAYQQEKIAEMRNLYNTIDYK